MKALEEHKDYFIKVLGGFLGGISVTNSGERELLEAMKYSLISEDAKYIRSFLVLETARMIEADVEMAEKLAVAIEMVHAYSLIHDDLPSMDDSNLRRGQLALHKKFSESTAIMAGNALSTMSFEIVAGIKNSEIAVKLIAGLAEASGLKGILSGQVLDLNPELKKAEFEVMNYHKTGKLIEFCCFGAGMLAGKALPELKVYGKSLGMAYQMKDDLLDEGEEGYSYLDFFGNKEILEKALLETINDCKDAIKGFSGNAVLLEIPEALAKRNY